MSIRFTPIKFYGNILLKKILKKEKSMIYTEMTRHALRICFEAHNNQADKSGLPYVFHPFHLAEQMEDENTTIVALLHDVVEDSEYTLEDLEDMGFNKEVLEAIKLLTHDKSVPYEDYIIKLKSNRIARIVKLADLNHNSDITRFKPVTKKDLRRLEKYKSAIQFLESDV